MLSAWSSTLTFVRRAYFVRHVLSFPHRLKDECWCPDVRNPGRTRLTRMLVGPEAPLWYRRPLPHSHILAGSVRHGDGEATALSTVAPPPAV
ncbi:hypothetical protein MRX96_042637 [Rhipicephalus microplus]